MQERVTSLLPDTTSWIGSHRLRRNSPLVAGVMFLISNLPTFFVLCAGPAIITAITGFVVYSSPLAYHQVYLIAVLQLGTLAWVLNSVVSFRMLTAKEIQLPASRLAIYALHSLPKILISVLAVFGIFILCLWYPYLLALTVCFLWAPFFVAGEAFAKVIPEPEQNDDYFDEDEEDQEAIEPRTFSNHAIWQIGLGRSFVFGISHVVTTLEMIALLWVASVTPIAFVRFVFTDHLGFASQIMEAVLPVFALGAVMMVGAGAFFQLIPKTAREELEVPKAIDWEIPLVKTAAERPNLIVFLALLPLAALSSWYVVRTERAARAMPEDVRCDNDGIRLRGDSLLWRVRIEDPSRQFRWLTPANFRLIATNSDTKQDSAASAAKIEAGKVEAGNAPIGEQKAEAVARAGIPTKSSGTTLPTSFAPYRVEPDRFYVLDSNGKYLAEKFQPWYGSLIVELRFPVTASIRRSDQLALHYGMFGLLPEPFNKSQLGLPLATVRTDAIEEEK